MLFDSAEAPDTTPPSDASTPEVATSPEAPNSENSPARMSIEEFNRVNQLNTEDSKEHWENRGIYQMDLDHRIDQISSLKDPSNPDGKYSFKGHAQAKPREAGAASESVTSEEAEKLAGNLAHELATSWVDARLDPTDSMRLGLMREAMVKEDFTEAMARFGAQLEQRLSVANPYVNMQTSEDRDWAQRWVVTLSRENYSLADFRQDERIRLNEEAQQKREGLQIQEADERARLNQETDQRREELLLKEANERTARGSERGDQRDSRELQDFRVSTQHLPVPRLNNEGQFRPEDRDKIIAVQDYFRDNFIDGAKAPNGPEMRVMVETLGNDGSLEVALKIFESQLKSEEASMKTAGNPERAAWARLWLENLPDIQHKVAARRFQSHLVELSAKAESEQHSTRYSYLEAALPGHYLEPGQMALSVDQRQQIEASVNSNWQQLALEVVNGRLSPEDVRGLRETVTVSDYRGIMRSVHREIETRQQQKKLLGQENWVKGWNNDYIANPGEYRGFGANLRSQFELIMKDWTRDETGTYRTSGQLFKDAAVGVVRWLIKRDIEKEQTDRAALREGIANFAREAPGVAARGLRAAGEGLREGYKYAVKRDLEAEQMQRAGLYEAIGRSTDRAERGVKAVDAAMDKFVGNYLPKLGEVATTLKDKIQLVENSKKAKGFIIGSLRSYVNWTEKQLWGVDFSQGAAKSVTSTSAAAFESTQSAPAMVEPTPATVEPTPASETDERALDGYLAANRVYDKAQLHIEAELPYLTYERQVTELDRADQEILRFLDNLDINTPKERSEAIVANAMANYHLWDNPNQLGPDGRTLGQIVRSIQNGRLQEPLTDLELATLLRRLRSIPPGSNIQILRRAAINLALRYVEQDVAEGVEDYNDSLGKLGPPPRVSRRAV